MRTAELLAELSVQFKEALADLKDVNEETWATAGFHEELAKAAVLVENAKGLYMKAMARTDADRRKTAASSTGTGNGTIRAIWSAASHLGQSRLMSRPHP